MWLADRRYQERGATMVDRLDLMRIAFPHGDLVIGLNQDLHGVGSSRAEGERLRDLPGAQSAALARKRLRLRVLGRLLLATPGDAWGGVLVLVWFRASF